MSDNYDGPQMAQKILRQQTEIERLRRQVEEAAIHIPAHVAIEIERLHKTLDNHLNSEAAETRRADKERDRARKADAEIVRLRGEVKLMRQMDAPTLAAIEKRDAEIERLRASERSAWNAAVERDGEIERLRGEAERRSRVEDERSQRAVEMEKEIERLRGLLRQARDGSWTDEPQWYAEVNKALGE